MATSQGRPSASICQPKAMAAHTPMAPTARLSPPVTITTIIEKPIMMLMAATRPSVNRLNGERKPLDSDREDDAEDEDQDQQAELVGEAEAQGSVATGAALVSARSTGRQAAASVVSSHCAIRHGLVRSAAIVEVTMLDLARQPAHPSNAEHCQQLGPRPADPPQRRRRPRQVAERAAPYLQAR